MDRAPQRLRSRARSRETRTRCPRIASARYRPTPKISGGQAHGHAERRRNDDGNDGNHQRGPPAVDQSAQDISAVAVGSEPVILCTYRGKPYFRVLLQRVVRGNKRAARARNNVMTTMAPPITAKVSLRRPRQTMPSWDCRPAIRDSAAESTPPGKRSAVCCARFSPTDSAKTRSRLRILDSRVDHRVKQIRDEIDKDEGARNDEHAALHHGIVAE